MLIFQKVAELQQFLTKSQQSGKTVGFVPTMGALHDGHLSLISKANESCDISVASIFVNPTQFNDSKDLDKYPRPYAKDVRKLINAGNKVLFHPKAEEVYPEGLDTQIKVKFGKLTSYMEGRFRPGHFEGMANVVSRLLDIVGPNRLFMGQKDFQQLSIVRSMIEQQKRDTELIACPIIREESGLAMSSRNERLDPELRLKAANLFKTLQWSAKQLGLMDIEEIEQKALDMLTQPGFKPEYFEIVDGKDLSKVENAADHDSIVACLAVWAGEVRLIDNHILKGERLVMGYTAKKVIIT